MEHKIIEGGELWLGFARSRIKALRATGQLYATNRFVLPDGAQVRVQITGEHDYIHIKSSGCVLTLDSGIVDVLTIGQAAPGSADPGILYESDAVQAYNGPFVLEPESTIRRNPASGSAGQFSGSLSKSTRFVGAVPIDQQAAGSFSPKTSDDGSLLLKKSLAVLCPASMFTGRCRLYVQALYGRHLYEGGSSSARMPMELAADANGAPALILDAFKREPQQSSLQIDTGTGIHLDAQGRHWLMKVNGTNVDIYPLLGNACAQGMRRYLAGSSLDGLPLNPTDKEHLETYILSTCLPDVLNKITVAITLNVTPYSMGYGWHWNWTGLTADIVVNNQFEQDPTNSAMRSTHYRLQLTPATDDEPWSAQTSIVEGPVDWTVYRVYWTLTHPEWGTYRLKKTTPQNSLVQACNAPFYAFYIRDELQVCRVQVLNNDASGTSRTMSHNYASSSTYQGAVEDGTYGLLGGFVDDQAGGNAYVSAYFTCGSLNSGELAQGRTTSGFRAELSNKVLGSGTDVFGWSGFATFFPEFGYPDEVTGLYEIAPPIFGQVKNFEYGMTYDIKSFDYSKQFASSATLVVPFYDAQAIYMQAASTADSTNTGTLENWHASLGGYDYVIDQVFAIGGDANNTVTYIKYGFNTGGAPSGAVSVGSQVVNEVVLDIYTDIKKLVCAAGVLDATFSHLGEFHDNVLSHVGAQFSTLSGTSNDSAVVLASGHITAFGAGSGPGTAPVLVGWV